MSLRNALEDLQNLLDRRFPIQGLNDYAICICNNNVWGYALLDHRVEKIVIIIHRQMSDEMIRIPTSEMNTLPFFEVAIEVYQADIDILVWAQLTAQLFEVTNDKIDPRKTPVMEVQQRWPPLEEGGVGPVVVMNLENFLQNRATGYRKGFHRIDFGRTFLEFF